MIKKPDKAERPKGYEPPRITTLKPDDIVEAVGPAVALYGLAPHLDDGW